MKVEWTKEKTFSYKLFYTNQKQCWNFAHNHHKKCNGFFEKKKIVVPQSLPTIHLYTKA